ncbi:MAG: GGDEF domain-containing protein [Pseudohongiellaceae bacterium]|jgi:GGDEF domain-containing protein
MVGSYQSTDKHIEADQMSDKHSKPDQRISLEKLELMTVLQSTLDLKSQLKYFLENLRNKLPIDGLSFVEEDRMLKVKIGRQSTHSCGYHLSKEEVGCGELIFKRSTRFSEQDLEAIEEAILLLLVPISNALKYHDAVNNSSINSFREISERHALTSMLSREIELAKRHNHPLCLLSLVVSAHTKAKSLNHELLQPLCQSFQTASNNTDMWFRVSATEFLILTHNALEDATKVAWELEQLENQSFEKDFSDESVAIRVGVAALTGTDSLNSLIKRAKQQVKLAEFA